MTIMDRIARLSWCTVGIHLVDLTDYHQRRARAARMGVNVKGFRAECARCGKWVRP